jgi:hypothetical protein
MLFPWRADGVGRLTVAWLWGSCTLALYGYTLDLRQGGMGTWWFFAGFACFGILALIGWLGMRAEKGEETEAGE